MTAVVATLGVRLQRWPADAVPPDVAPHLLELTLPLGMMSGTFAGCANPDRQTRGQVLAAQIDGNYVGWALRWQFDRNAVWHLYLYVHEDHRRRGIGSLLVAESRYRMRRDSRMIVHGHNPDAAAFFNQVATFVPHLDVRP